jgi:hypothetical protein
MGDSEKNAGHGEDSHRIEPMKALDDLFVHSYGLYIYSNISYKKYLLQSGRYMKL